MSITANELNSLLDYNNETGLLTWKIRPNKRIFAGTIAGNKDGYGYITITIKGKSYLAHRLIWIMVYGSLDNNLIIDHINHIRDDNRLVNLRAITKADNARNRTKQDSNLQETGIWYCKRRKRYVAEITYNGKKVYQKTFKDIDTAIKERKEKSIELGFHINHGE